MLTVHELYTELSQRDRDAEVTVKNGAIYVGDEALTEEDEVTDGDPTVASENAARLLAAQEVAAVVAVQEVAAAALSEAP